MKTSGFEKQCQGRQDPLANQILCASNWIQLLLYYRAVKVDTFQMDQLSNVSRFLVLKLDI